MGCLPNDRVKAKTYGRAIPICEQKDALTDQSAPRASSGQPKEGAGVTFPDGDIAGGGGGGKDTTAL